MSLTDGWSWIRINAAALTVVGAFVGGLTGSVWYLGTLMGSLATTTAVGAVDEKVDAINVKVETLATTTAVGAVDEKVDAVNAKVETIQAMFPLMMSCIIDQNRQTLTAIARPEAAATEVAPLESCRIAQALAQEAAVGRFVAPSR